MYKVSFIDVIGADTLTHTHSAVEKEEKYYVHACLNCLPPKQNI